MNRLPLAMVLAGVLAAALAGCLADGDDAGASDADVDRSADREVDQGCNVNDGEGPMGPGRPLSVTSTAGAGSANAQVLLEAQPVLGPVDLVLERGDETVWEDQAEGEGAYEYTTHVNGLAAGDYTLTASADGGGEARIELTVTWGGGKCS